MLENTYTQIEQLQTQIHNQLQMLKSIDPTTLRGSAGAPLSRAVHVRDAAGRSVEHRLQRRRRKSRLRPDVPASRSRSGATSNTPTSTTTTTAGTPRSRRPRKRPSALSPAISTLDADNRAMADILRSRIPPRRDRSGSLQLINQQLALIHKDLGSRRPEPRHHRPRAHELERRRRRASR